MSCGCTDELHGGSECAEHAAKTRRIIEQASAAFNRSADKARRERIATAVLSGLAATVLDAETAMTSRSGKLAAALSIAWTDALIAGLDK